MAKEISLNNRYDSVNEFKAAVKSALLLIPEGVIRIYTWYDHAAGGNIPHTNVVLQQKFGPICIGGMRINKFDHSNVNDRCEEWAIEAISELINSGIHVYPRIRTSWQA